MVVHTLRDDQPSQYDHLLGDEEQSTPTIQAQSLPSQRKETFWTWNLQEDPKWYHMMLMCFCPCLVGPVCSLARRADYRRLLITFMLWVSLAQIVYFIIELGFGGVTNVQENPALGPKIRTLIRLGGKYAPDIKYKYHIHRLFLPILMHAGFLHIILNLFMQWTLALDFEAKWGFFRMAIIYFVSGIAGNLLSCCVMPSAVSVGASGALMGIIGARAADITVRWSAMNESERIIHGTSAVFFLFLQFTLSFNSPYIDWSAHTGGLIVGFVLGLSLFCFEVENRPIRYCLLVVGFLLTIAFFVTFSLLFALAVNVPRP